MMRQRKAATLGFGLFAAIFLACAASQAFSEVNVNINIGPPAVVVHEPPEMVVIPRTMVYYAPAVEAELFFYRGHWWTSYEGRWFRSRAYSGPWVVVGPRYVPVEIVRLPRDYRTVYVREGRVPYGQLKKHWEHREYERRKHVGEWKEGKRERNEENRERKEYRKDSREEWQERGERGHGRGERGPDR